ncbi:MAG: hypothetical protein U0325_25315 [Polyangiales bacterium]
MPLQRRPARVQRLHWRDGDRALEVERIEDLFAPTSLHAWARGPARGSKRCARPSTPTSRPTAK